MLQIVHFLFSMPVVYRPHPSFSIIATAHAQALCWKGSSSHITAIYAAECCNTVLLLVAAEHAGYVLYRALVALLIARNFRALHSNTVQQY